MKISPLDIQQQQFRVRFRGFDMVEVDNFLDLVANQFEELLRENNLLKEEDRKKIERIQELEGAEKEMRNALISAQQICEGMKENARKEGELIIAEARGNGRKILEEVQAEATKIETEIFQLKRQRAEFEASLKERIGMFQRLLETPPASRNSSPGEEGR